ncbi:exonuclease [Stenotrophomonas phage BUCT609]|uniref:Exonuclease n=1 Tax=Stenotrophomonas phage BUCT609 TaxID=2834250 RepID=A0A8E6PL60_9CAUD|nr:exonuclease [Stenotrophomonas phage BUCT609]
MSAVSMKEKLAAYAKDHAMPGTTGRVLVPGMPLHIDGDYLCYYCAGNDETSPDTARANVIDRIKRACEVSGADPSKVFVHMSTPDCTKGLRFIVADSPTSKPYQGQRNTGRKPKNWQHLRDWIDDYSGPFFTTAQWRDREADDGMAHVSEAGYALGKTPAVMTADKDMRMFAGLHVVWKTFELVEVLPGTYDKVAGGKQYGHKFFWMQMLMGDTADNILGLPRVGEVAAVKTLAGTTCNQEAFDAVIDVYKSKMGDDYAEHFVEQAILLWMRTSAKAPLLDFIDGMKVIWPADIIRAASRVRARVADHPGNPANVR